MLGFGVAAVNVVRVVIADDHDIVRAGISSLLKTTPDLEVIGEARNGEEACRLAAELSPDVLLMDLSMPLLDGERATAQIHRESPHVAVLALTMHEDRGRLARVMRAGAAGYVLKRADAQELLRAIRSVAAGGNYVDPELAGLALRHAEAAAPAALSERETEVLRRTAWGASNKDIAEQLGISIKTVETYKARIAGKLGLSRRSEFVRYAVDQGWLTDD